MDAPVPDGATRFVPVEAEGSDADGALIWVLLHASLDGFLDVLEVLRANGEPVTSMPRPQRLFRTVYESHP